MSSFGALAATGSILNFVFVDLFPDTPGKTSCSYHDVGVMGTTPKQRPYHVNPVKLQFLRKEAEYILAIGIIEPSSSEWSSPVSSSPKVMDLDTVSVPTFARSMLLQNQTPTQYPG